MQLILNSSRTEKAIRNEINQTSKRINRLCEEIDSLRAQCYWYRYRKEICNLEEAKERIEWRVVKLRKAINRMNKLGRELNEKIHKAD